jgi:hypothetical protein
MTAGDGGREDTFLFALLIIIGSFDEDRTE